MSKVYANGRSVVHKGDSQVNTCPAPDVCKTPSPGGPVPVPYVNVARDGDLASGSLSVTVEGNPVALKDSNLSTSSGDEPGTAGGGLISSKTKGKMTWASTSIDVKIEGKGVVRFLDICLHNGNNSNSGGQPTQGTPNQAQGSSPTKCQPHTWERLKDSDTPQDRLQKLATSSQSGDKYNACIAQQLIGQGKSVDISLRFKCSVCGEYQEVDLVVDGAPRECKAGNQSAKKKQTLNYVEISNSHFGGAQVSIFYETAARCAQDAPHVARWGAAATHMPC